jgi:thiamine pyrophosphate-dependent acetolactate synthase large subunit-like protein
MSGDYAKVAEGLGAVGIAVAQSNKLAPGLARARQLNAEGRTVLLDIHFNLEGRRPNFS